VDGDEIVNWLNRQKIFIPLQDFRETAEAVLLFGIAPKSNQKSLGPVFQKPRKNSTAY